MDIEDGELQVRYVEDNVLWLSLALHIAYYIDSSSETLYFQGCSLETVSLKKKKKQVFKSILTFVK